ATDNANRFEESAKKERRRAMEMPVRWRTRKTRFPQLPWKTLRVSHIPAAPTAVFFNSQSGTYVSEHPLPMSPGHTGVFRGGWKSSNHFPPASNPFHGTPRKITSS